MQITQINSNQSFGRKFELNDTTKKGFEQTTGLTYMELVNLPLRESKKLAKTRKTNQGVFKSQIDPNSPEYYAGRPDLVPDDPYLANGRLLKLEDVRKRIFPKDKWYNRISKKVKSSFKNIFTTSN